MKHNLRKIPKDILAKIKTIKGNIVVGCAVKFKADILNGGCLKHLGIALAPGGLKFPATILPPRGRGKFTSRNIDGDTIIRKDLQKEAHYRSMQAPNWGGSRNGTHEANRRYKRFPRQFVPPALLEISIACKDTYPGLVAYVISFKVVEVLDKTVPKFEERLFANLNLLQENVGACGVESSEISMADYTKSLHLTWEILPPGTLNEVLQRVFLGKTPSKEDKDVVIERYEFFMSLEPKQLVYGTNGFRRYFGALLEDDLVVFEHIEYGNAIYILFNNWQELSKRSRNDLLSGNFGKDFERVPHISRWKEEVKKIVAKRRDSGRNLL